VSPLLELIRQQALAAGADAAIVSNHWAEGGAGAHALAEAVVTCLGSFHAGTETELVFAFRIPRRPQLR